MMEAERNSETLVYLYKTTRHHIPEGYHIYYLLRLFHEFLYNDVCL